MSLLEWRDDFLIGIAEVDGEHRELIALLNEMHDEALRHRSAAQVATVLGEINVRIAAHFALEEKNMELLGYAGYAAHKAEHERLLDQITEIMEEVDQSGRYDPDALSAAVSAWFGEHFRTHDAELHRWLERRK